MPMFGGILVSNLVFCLPFRPVSFHRNNDPNLSKVEIEMLQKSLPLREIPYNAKK